MSNNNLKNYNLTLVTMIVFNLVVLLGDDFVNLIKTFQESTNGVIGGNFIITAIIPILTYVINGIIPSNTKAQVVFMRIRNPLPGSRIFSELILKDERIRVDTFT